MKNIWTAVTGDGDGGKYYSNQEFQRVLLAKLISDEAVFTQCEHAVRTEFFDDPLVPPVRFVFKHHADYHSLPSWQIINAATGVDLSDIDPLQPDEREWFLDQVEQFCRFRAAENVILDGIDLLRQGSASEIERRIIEARQISIREVSQKFRPVQTEDFATDALPQWLLPDLLFEQQIGVCYAPPGSYKTFTVLSLALLLAYGMTLHGRRLYARNVVYVAGEGGTMVSIRKRAWLHHHGLPIKNDGLSILPRPVQLLDAAEVGEFIRAMRPYNPGLVVLDTLSTCIAGANESAPEVMTAAIEAAKRIRDELGCAVLIVHHPGKDESRGARGHSSLLGNVDAMWLIGKAVGNGTITLAVEKQKDAPVAKPMHFAVLHQALPIRDRYGEQITSCVVRELSVPDTGEKPYGEIPGTELSKETADLMRFGEAMELNLPYSGSGMYELIGGRKADVVASIEQAIPVGETRRVRTARHGVVEFSRIKGPRGAKLLSIRQVEGKEV